MKFFIIIFSLILQIEELGKIEKASGTVFLQREGKKNIIFGGETVYSGDILLTEKKGYVEIVFKEGHRIEVGENTELKIDKTLLGEEGIFRKFLLKINIFMGRVRGYLRKGRGDWVNFTSPTSVVGVRGTEFEIICADDGSSAVEVSEGEVSLLTDDIKTLKEGERAIYDITEERLEVLPSETAFSIEEWLSKKKKEWEERKKEIEERHNRRLKRIIDKYEDTMERIKSSAERGEEEDMELGLSIFSMIDDGLSNTGEFMRKRDLKNMYEKRVKEVRERWERRRREIMERFEKRRKEIKERMERKREEIERKMEEKRKNR
jgi:hypothetical protein